MFLFLSVSLWVRAETLQYNKDFFLCVCVCQSFSEHSSFQSIFLPVIHLHTVIKQPEFCLRGTAVSSSCRRLRQGAEACRGPRLLSRASRATSQPASSFRSPHGTGWLWTTPLERFLTTFLIQGCIWLPVTFPANIYHCFSSHGANKMALLGFRRIHREAGGVRGRLGHCWCTLLRGWQPEQALTNPLSPPWQFDGWFIVPSFSTE